MDLELKIKDVTNIEDKDGVKKAILKDADPLDFFNQTIDDALLQGFLSDDKVKSYIAKKIGVEGLLATYPKEEVLGKVGWDFVKEFFKDHMNREDILNHIGWEKVREHFADNIRQLGTQNSINTSESILGALDESEGKA